ncbi:unnamed protein product [Xylocopa violacea]|uniref:Uncharacterized protein n=1 Tax=Xylocopa violacea TaxID=135666 RepID=A0ABP1N815_XYLVO
MPEREFAAYNIKANVIKTSVDQTIMKTVLNVTTKIILDIIEASPGKSMYVDTKEALIERLARSEGAKLRKFPFGIELGNKKSFQFLREVRQLAEKHVRENVLNTVWIQRLPTKTQEMLAILEDASQERLAKIANKSRELSEVPTCSGMIPLGHKMATWSPLQDTRRAQKRR